MSQLPDRPDRPRGEGFTDIPEAEYEDASKRLTFPKQRQRLVAFYDELLTNNPHYALAADAYVAIVERYMNSVPMQDICDDLGVTRTEVSMVIQLSGVRRGMDADDITQTTVARLYALLYAAQIEIFRLREQINPS